MANLAQTVNVLQALILTNGAAFILTPTYHIFDLYQVHQDATLLETTIANGAIKTLPLNWQRFLCTLMNYTDCTLFVPFASFVTFTLNRRIVGHGRLQPGQQLLFFGIGQFGLAVHQ